MKQLIHLLGQHRFYAAASIVGTAVTLAFVMVVVMVYDFRTADVPPEAERSRMLYNTGTQCMRANGTNMMGYRGLGPEVFETLYGGLPGVDTLTWHGGLQRALCSLPASSDRQSVFLRPVAANWFSFFQYDFVAGRPFTQAEYDAGRAAFQEAEDEWRSYRSLEDGVTRRFVVITERLARRLFGSASRAVGGEMQMDFQPVRVVGVVRDVSSIFQTAYADVLHGQAQPMYALMLSINPTRVDVNVHPQKSEVRFRDSQLVHGFVTRAIMKALSFAAGEESALPPEAAGSVPTQQNSMTAGANAGAPTVL